MNDNAFERDTGSDDCVTAIELGQMPQQSEVRQPDDDWTGLNDPKTRRKLQNRLNQRLWRKRQRRSKLNQGAEKDHARTTSGTASSSTGSSRITSPIPGMDVREVTSLGQKTLCATKIDLTEPPDFSVSVCQAAPTDIQKNITRFEKWAHQSYLMGSPRVDLLLTLIQFNVFRALCSNTSSIGFDMEWLLNGDAISPFNTMTSNELSPSMPESLRPTQLQRIVEHHPWIDLFPLPEIRNNLLLAGEEYDDTDICMDVVEIGGKPKEKCGLIVWGAPWDPYAWEASPDFLQKWAWVVAGCQTIFKSTNYWRMRRGEPPIYNVQRNRPDHKIGEV